MDKYKHIFLVGIKGAGMANIAIFLSEMGKKVSGSDVVEEFITDGELKNIQILTSFEAQILPGDVDLVVFSGSHNGTENPQVQEALKRGITVMSQSELLGELMGEFKTAVAVCGTHGKTNTASLLAYLLIKIGKNPSYIVGTSRFNDVAGGHYGEKDFFIVEADEYAIDPPRNNSPKFHLLHPTHILCTSIDFDHPDVFRDLEQTKEEFIKFFNKVSGEKKLFLCGDDINIMDLTRKFPEDNYIIYGFSSISDFIVSNLVQTQGITLFDVSSDDHKVGSFSTLLSGDKIIGNVTGVISLLLSLGISADDIKKHITEFVGAKRRFEKVATVGDIDLYDDYAHHPQEIEATLDSARKRFPGRKIITIFQPHTFSRTESLKNEFVEALAKSDKTFLTPIFASAREDSSKFNITSDKLVALASEKGISSIESYSTKEDLINKLKTSVEPGMVLFTMGAGDVYKLKNDIISMLNSR